MWRKENFTDAEIYGLFFFSLPQASLFLAETGESLTFIYIV